MKKICNFVTGNMQILVLIYAIMAVAVFAAVNIFFWKISFDLDKEMREEMRECGDYHIDTDEARFGKTVTRVCGFILSISIISFTACRWTDKKQGYQLSTKVEKEDASLNFFMTMIIPLLLDDVGTIQGAVTFLILIDIDQIASAERVITVNNAVQ